MQYNGNSKLHHKDEIIVFTIVFQIAILACKNMVVTTLQIAHNFNTYLNTLIFVVMILLYIRCFLRINFRIQIGSLYIILASFIFFMMTYLFNNELLTYNYVISELRIFMVYCVPLIILVPLLHDTDKLLNVFYFASYFMSFVALISFVLILFGLETVRDYSMSYGKAAMIPSIFLFSKAFRENTVKDYVLAGMCTAAIFILGSRWPLLCVGSFIIYGFISKKYLNKMRRILSIMLLIIIFFFLATNHIKMLTGLNIFLNRHGVNSRTISMILNDKTIYDSGRSQIYQQLTSKLQESPLLGYGAFGGVVALDDELPHNFLLDVWANFGYVGGSVVLMYSAYMTLKYFWVNRGSAYSELIAVYACLIWPKITIGESFWSSDKYWMLMSLILLGGHIKLSTKRVRETINANPVYCVEQKINPRKKVM